LALLDRALVRLLPAVPRTVVQRVSSRYIAGTTLAEAVETVRALNAEGKLATIDVLGEEISTAAEAAAFTRSYHDVFEAIEREGLDSNVSVKPTALGLGLGLSYDLLRQNLEALVTDAAARGNFVRIDMEDTSTTDDTLRVYRELRTDGHRNVGPVLQASLRRTIADVAGIHNARLCKGIYVEPPELQYQDDEEVRASFMKALEALLDEGAYVGIATHDDRLIDGALELVSERGLSVETYEFQMLLGVRPELGDALVREGHRLRIYVPFGERWYEYSLRRLQENPKVAGYVASDVLHRLLPGRNGR
jgi:proline dehydrogenase